MIAPAAAPKPSRAESARVGAAVAQAWRQRSLFGYFGRRFNEKRYVRTWLGPIWVVLRPGLTLGWQLFVFVSIARIGAGSEVPFALTLLLGFAGWSLFAESAYWATRSLELNRRALRAIRIPGLVIVAAGVTPAVIDFLVVTVFFLAASAIYLVIDGSLHIELSAATLLIAPAAMMLVLIGVGIGLLLAVPGAQARDVRFGLRFALTVWYFVTPVVYPLSAVPSLVRPLVELNPVTAPIGLLKNGVLHTGAPSVESLVVSGISCTALLAVGLVVFVRYERRVLDLS